jgi:hypothetical protein
VDFPNASKSFCPTKKLRSVCRPIEYGSDFDEKGHRNTGYIWTILQKINLIPYLTGSIVDLEKLLSGIVLEPIALRKSCDFDFFDAPNSLYSYCFHIHDSHFTLTDK